MVILLRRRRKRRLERRARAEALANLNGFHALHVARPSESRHLRDGFVIEGSVLARLLRTRLLHVEARIALVPATLAETPDDQTHDQASEQRSARHPTGRANGTRP
jgi:hypothetical protein